MLQEAMTFKKFHDRFGKDDKNVKWTGSVFTLLFGYRPLYIPMTLLHALEILNTDGMNWY